MCGIVGAYFRRPVDAFPVRQMADAVSHRGPDDEGYLLADPDSGFFEARGGADSHAGLALQDIESTWPEGVRLVFGHRRLSIRDLSEAGHQPMRDAEGDVWIVYNGEIYNDGELRRELENGGARFRSSSDTEVVLQAYKAWGKDCLRRLNGMWAFVIWDRKKKILWGARDRFGIKPFYYTHQKGNFYFASEVKALLQIPGLPVRPSEEAVFHFLAFALQHHDERTFFEGIDSLRPGFEFTLDADGQFRESPWYELPRPRPEKPYCAEDADLFGEKLGRAVRIRLRSDVPVGSCLSGGLDSSSLVALAGGAYPGRFKTFSACFEDKRYNERRYIEEILKRTGAEPHFVFPEAKAFWREWSDLIYQHEGPLPTTTLYSQWCVMREAGKKGVPVLLDGQGGDELLGGYLRYRANRTLGRLMSGDPGALVKAIVNPLVASMLAYFALPASLSRPMLRARLPSGKFLAREFRSRSGYSIDAYYHERGNAQKNLNDALASDFLKYSLPALLMYEDKNSMKFSVETRLPFLDFELVEWLFSLEEGAKIDSHETKRILREGMTGMLPEAVRRRQDKMGFSTPQAEWAAVGAQTVRPLLKKARSSMLSQWLNIPKLEEAFDRGEWGDGLIWWAVNLIFWYNVFFEQKRGFRPREDSHSEPVLSA